MSLKDNTIRWRKRNPWQGSYYNAKNRCMNKNHNKYKYYGGKGIEFRLTLDEVKSLWLRDNADKLKRPSIDRIDNSGNYEFSNCRFIELDKNIGKYKSILCMDKNGDLKKIYRNMREASNDMGVAIQSISKACTSISETCCGFIWKAIPKD